MRELFQEIIKRLKTGEPLVLTTVIASSGSTPKGAGARMAVGAGGRIAGTIGGGAVEEEVVEAAMAALGEKRSRLEEFHLSKSQVADLGMICGGAVTVFFQYLCPENTELLKLLEQIPRCMDRDEDSWILMDITDGQACTMGLYCESRGLEGIALEHMEPLLSANAVQAELGNRLYYSEPLSLSGKVYVFGGGHVAQELVPLISHLGFCCVVYDDREEFASADVFPQAEAVIVGDFTNIFENLAVRKQDYVAVMTRGHEHDYEVQRQVLKTPAHYIGVMGSRGKLASICEKLWKEGYTEEDTSRIHSPIGLPILAETPAEIAVSVAAELIRDRASGRSSDRREE